MRLIFGQGNILVTEAGNSERRNIIMEQDRGSGIAGAECTELDRMPGSEIPEEVFESAAVCLTFTNPVSCAAVLEKCLQSMVAFKGSGQTLDPGNPVHLELWESIERLWTALLMPTTSMDITHD